MPTMGRYCKAYAADCFAEYSGWPARGASPDEGDEQDRYYFLQENYTVTRDIFLEDVIFDEVTEAWRQFCHDRLKFTIPADISPRTPSATDAA